MCCFKKPKRIKRKSIYPEPNKKNKIYISNQELYFDEKQLPVQNATNIQPLNL